MKIESHKSALAEYLGFIEQARHSLEKSKRLLLIANSQAATEIVSILMHKLNIIDIGAVIKHTQLDSQNWWDSLPDFTKKKDISKLASDIEKARNLAYGNFSKINEEFLIDIIKHLFNLKGKTEEVMNEKLESEA